MALTPRVLLDSLRALRDAAALHDRPYLCVSAGDRRALQGRVDLGPLAEAWLELGTPVEPFVVGDKRLLIQPYQLIEALASRPDWPRRLLPVGEVGPLALLALDQSSGALVEVTGQEVAVRAQAGALLGDLTLWVERIQPGQVHAVRSYHAIEADATAALQTALGPHLHQRWLFSGLRPVAEVRAVLQAGLRLNLWTFWACATLTSVAPFLGWWLGQAATPAHPWQGVALTLLVVGGMPGWLWAQSGREVGDLRACLARLPG